MEWPWKLKITDQLFSVIVGDIPPEYWMKSFMYNYNVQRAINSIIKMRIDYVRTVLYSFAIK